MEREGLELIGREVELDAIDAFVADRSALPRALVIEGPAGAGKTTLWRAAVERARAAGYLVLACRPAGAEVQLSLAALSDLLEPQLPAVLDELPTPQRRALEIALLLEADAGRAPDRRALSAGVLNVIRALARQQPIALAVDDAQWVDTPSAEVLEFALRRLGDAPVAVVASRRTASATGPTTGTIRGLRVEGALERPPERIEVGPMTLGALHRLLRTRTSLEFNRRTLQRIHKTSGGNPFYALEIARAMERDPRPGEQLPLSTGLNELLSQQLGGLEGGTRDALFVAAAASAPTIELVEAATGSRAREALAPAIAAAVVRLDSSTIEFGHPLLAAAAYALPDAATRRSWHARIADAVADPETKARHVALARPGQDLEVATLLHVAARSAAGRGASASAAELYASAIDRLPPGLEEERARWIAEAAPLLVSNGEADRARALIESGLADVPSGPVRFDLLQLLAPLVEGDPSGIQHQLEIIEEALVEAGTDPRMRAAALLDREMWHRGERGLADALVIARQALEAAERAGDVFLLAHANVRIADLEVLLGLGGEPVARFRRALELDALVHVDAESAAPAMLAVCLIRIGRLDEARPLLLTLRDRAIAEGDEASHNQLCIFLTELEWLAGNWDAAARYADEGFEVAEQAGLRMRQGSSLSMAALVEASRGDPELARSMAVQAREICEEVKDRGYTNYARQVLAFLELSLGNPAGAHGHAETYALSGEIEGPKRLAFVGDEIEALVQIGDLEGAANLADEVARRGEQIKRPPLCAAAARGRALILAARGDSDGAIRAATESVTTFESLGLPFEHARALLVLGEIQRRAKQRRTARETLTAAEAQFLRLGARHWAERAAAERARVGGRTSIEGLSETELRVARLVADGRSNKEIAAELFVTVRAVESNLSKVYAKLGIRSRTEVARRL